MPGTRAISSSSRSRPLEPGTVWAIDWGSSVVADGRSFQVAAYRAARVRFRGGATDLVESPSLTVRAVSAAEMQPLARTILTELCGPEPERIPELPRPVDALREWAEWSEVARTVRDAAAGDLVLVDGSLHGGPLVPKQVVRRVHEEAVARGVSMAGVVKASTLYWGRNAPLVTLLKRRGDREVGHVACGGRGSRPIPCSRGCTSATSSSRTSRRRRRTRSASTSRTARARLARCSAGWRGSRDDPAFVGYPYPLARAHQAARVTGYAGGGRPARVPRGALAPRDVARTTSRSCSRTSTRC